MPVMSREICLAAATTGGRLAAAGRCLRALLLLLACGGLLTSCASHQRAAARNATHSLTRPAGRPQGPRTRAHALAFARAVNLQASDVPGFTASPRQERDSAAEKRLQRRLLRCAGAGDQAGGIAAVRSKYFQLKRGIIDLSVSSEVVVAKSSSAAASELAAIRSSRVRGCFSSYLDSLLKSQRHGGASVGPVSILSGTPPAPGSDGSYGWRITATFSIDQIRASLYVDLLGFVIGPARVTLSSTGALRPFPASIQQRLFVLLLARARAHAV